MIYIYDVLGNFNDELIDFYDWLESDYMEHIRKIPMIKVSEKFYIDLVNKNIIECKSTKILWDSGNKWGREIKKTIELSY